MKKGILLFGLLLSVMALLPSQHLCAQTSNPWNGPRFSSVQVANTVSQWISDHQLIPDAEGEWYRVDYTYMGRGQWLAVITWGTGFGSQTLGTSSLLIKNSGSYTEM